MGAREEKSLTHKPEHQHNAGRMTVTPPSILQVFFLKIVFASLLLLKNGTT